MIHIPRHMRTKGGEPDEDQQKGRAEREGQAPRGEVLGPDEVRGFWQAMLQLKEVKETIIAGSAIQTFDFFFQTLPVARGELRIVEMAGFFTQPIFNRLLVRTVGP